ncbi:ORMDL domain-containing protein [Chloropicon primus]|uniref:ORMDL domain-containing protein n=1 Tax=Chloropicon primus TaxID=1764295 RepID=A0A5B8MV79_9CHLO|nr:ORMDL domain-containing protein [Chloropicon primus]UPR02757.1 ORMDL domain-containing protein [Chloropicon primus]|eukprot:QDZ23545.1 ORMDL domain-containing protein [Chloropicon primus]
MIKRIESSPQLNANVEWVNRKSFWTFYVTIVLVLWLMVSTAVPIGLAWTYVNLIHNSVTFYLLHWKKGTPVYYDQGKYDHLTFWEQVDGGSQFTDNKKFFTIIPIAIFIIATNSSDFREQPLLLNVMSLLAVLIAKMPQMHTVRIFGINK